MIDDDIVLNVAKLAKLSIEPERVHELQKQFTNILMDFQKLQELDTSGVEPLVSPVEDEFAAREDKALVENTVEDILQNAPDKKGSLFKVPPVV